MVTAVAPSIAYPDTYAPFNVNTINQIALVLGAKHSGARKAEKEEGKEGRTFPAIPRKVTKAVPRVVRERRSEDRLAGVLDALRKGRNELYDVRAAERRARKREQHVREREAVEH